VHFVSSAANKREGGEKRLTPGVEDHVVTLAVEDVGGVAQTLGSACLGALEAVPRVLVGGGVLDLIQLSAVWCYCSLRRGSMTYAVLANALVTFVEDNRRVVILRVVPSAAKHGQYSRIISQDR
jgi:hypothetical protein